MADRGRVDSDGTDSEGALKRMKVEGRVSEVTPASKRVIDVVIRRVDSAVLLARLQRGRGALKLSPNSETLIRVANGIRPSSVSVIRVSIRTVLHQRLDQSGLGMPRSGPDWGSDPNRTGPHPRSGPGSGPYPNVPAAAPPPSLPPRHCPHIVVIITVVVVVVFIVVKVVLWVVVEGFVAVAQSLRRRRNRPRHCRLAFEVVAVAVVNVIASLRWLFLLLYRPAQSGVGEVPWWRKYFFNKSTTERPTSNGNPAHCRATCVLKLGGRNWWRHGSRGQVGVGVVCGHISVVMVGITRGRSGRPQFVAGVVGTRTLHSREDGKHDGTKEGACRSSSASPLRGGLRRESPRTPRVLMDISGHSRRMGTGKYMALLEQHPEKQAGFAELDDVTMLAPLSTSTVETTLQLLTLMFTSRGQSSPLDTRLLVAPLLTHDPLTSTGLCVPSLVAVSSITLALASTLVAGDGSGIVGEQDFPSCSPRAQIGLDFYFPTLRLTAPMATATDSKLGWVDMRTGSRSQAHGAGKQVPVTVGPGMGLV
ncbi:hypothetical protein EDB85DRAFT_1894902 [Lactarius pseudohatsudake]|nr:hypothetical protein EDB85DRAFT_1894902 [Lactarius pseudohatsudake]